MMKHDELLKWIKETQKGIPVPQPAFHLAERHSLKTFFEMEEKSGFRRTAEELQRTNKLSQGLIGPLEELHCLNFPPPGDPFDKLGEQVKKLLDDYNSHFRLPAKEEIVQLMSQLDGDIGKGIQKYVESNDVFLKSAMEAMRSPWLDVQETMKSLTGFAGLQTLGNALETVPTFSDQLTETLRAGLGDWRDPITWPDPIFSDVVARTEFYIDRGFDPSLTDFPATAFEESLDIAGLRSDPPVLVDIYGAPISRSESDVEEAAFARTNTAHDWLQRFETRLRRFIDAAMTAVFGADWARKRLPNGLYEKWQEKKSQAERADGEGYPLIAYADFTDYVSIICKRDNWREVFQAIFGRQESVQESLQRLYPIRICTMHARLITQEDELFLYVEIKRLMKAIS